MAPWPQPPSLSEPLDYDFLRRGYTDNCIPSIRRAHLKEQGDDDDRRLQRLPPGRQPFQPLFPHLWMNHPIQSFSGGPIAEHALTQHGPIDPPVRGQDALSKRVDHAPVYRLPGRHQCMRDLVRIHDLNSGGGPNARHLTLSATDPAGQTHLDPVPCH